MWRVGENPGAFLVRLAGDFAARLENVAHALTHEGQNVTLDGVEQALRVILRSAAYSEAQLRGGTDSLTSAIHRYALLSHFDLAKELLDVMVGTDADAAEKAEAWFAYGLSGDIPNRTIALSQEALDAIRHLHGAHPEATVREEFAKALFLQLRSLADDSADSASLLQGELLTLAKEYPNGAILTKIVQVLTEGRDVHGRIVLDLQTNRSTSLRLRAKMFPIICA